MQQQQHKNTFLGRGTANGVEFIRVFEEILESIELESIARRAVEVSTHAGAFPSHEILHDHNGNLVQMQATKYTPTYTVLPGIGAIIKK